MSHRLHLVEFVVERVVPGLETEAVGSDEFSAATDAVATLFARNGDDFVRVSTSLKTSDGKRAVGTKLDRDHPGSRALLAKKSFSGRATLFNKPYMTRYVPLDEA